MFLKSPGFDYILSYIGVAIFIGLTAWDSQKIKQMLLMQPDMSEGAQKLALLGSLTLYLDFINLFLICSVSSAATETKMRLKFRRRLHTNKIIIIIKKAGFGFEASFLYFYYFLLHSVYHQQPLRNTTIPIIS